MRFSIITCSYNTLEGLKAVARSAREMVDRSWEMGEGGSYTLEHIIIDGGSTDGTTAWLAEQVSAVGDGRWEIEDRGFVDSQTTPQSTISNLQSSAAGPHYQLRWLSEPDRGLYDALNKGLRMATGDVIGILHTDDVWEPGVLERVWHALRAENGRSEIEDGASSGAVDDSLTSIPTPARRRGRDQLPTPAPEAQTPISHLSSSISHPEGVYGDLLYVDANDITKVRRVWRSGSYDRKKWWNGWMPPHPALFVTRELAERVGEYRLDLGSAADYEWMLRAGLVHDAKFVYIHDLEQKQKGSLAFSTFSPPEFRDGENVKMHGRTPFAFAPFVRMRVGGASNATVKGRLKAHGADRKAWEVNGLKPKWWTLKMKVIRKLPQWMSAIGATWAAAQRQ